MTDVIDDLNELTEDPSKFTNEYVKNTALTAALALESQAKFIILGQQQLDKMHVNFMKLQELSAMAVDNRNKTQDNFDSAFAVIARVKKVVDIMECYCYAKGACCRKCQINEAILKDLT